MKEPNMPADIVMSKFKAGKLHSGAKNGPLVTNPAQAKAILLSETQKHGAEPATKETPGFKAALTIKPSFGAKSSFMRKTRGKVA